MCLMAGEGSAIGMVRGYHGSVLITPMLLLLFPSATVPMMNSVIISVWGGLQGGVVRSDEDGRDVGQAGIHLR